MAKTKKSDSLWTVLLETIRIYIMNSGKFTLYMLFPVLGQLAALTVIFTINYIYTNNLPALIEKYPVFNNFSTIMLVAMAITLPALFVFCKAFWDYLVCYGALNSMTEGVLVNGRVYDFMSHNEVVTRHVFRFIGIWLVLSILSFFAIIPFFTVIVLAGLIYFILVFQVFTFEDDLSVKGCFKRSFQIIKGNFARTFLLIILVGGFTYMLLPNGVYVLFDFLKINEGLLTVLEKWVMTFPIEQLNITLVQLHQEMVTPLEIARLLLQQIEFFAVIGLTLPMRSICWTLWYKNLAPLTEICDKKTGK